MATTNWEWEDTDKVDRFNVSRQTVEEPIEPPPTDPDDPTTKTVVKTTIIREQKWTLVRKRKVDDEFSLPANTEEGTEQSSLTAYNGTRSTTQTNPTFYDGTGNIIVPFRCISDRTSESDNGVEWNIQTQTWEAGYSYTEAN